MSSKRLLLYFAFCFAIASTASVFAKTDRVEFYEGIAEGNYLIGDLRGAERSIEQLLRLEPDYVPGLTLKARILLDQNKPAEALETARKAVELEPDKLEHRLLTALVLGNMQRRAEALEIIHYVIERAEPTSDDARAAGQLMGLLQMAEGQWDEAAEAFNAIYLADPESANTSLRLASEAYLEKARTEMQVGEQDEAIAAIDQAIAVYENQTGEESLAQRTSLRMMRARFLTQLGRGEEAARDLQSLSAQQPDNYEARITLASIYASVGRWEAVEETMEPLSSLPGLKDVALYFEGRAALSENRVGTARARFEEAIEELPEDADQLRRSLFFYRGVCLNKLNRPDEGEALILNAFDAGFRPETSEEAILLSQTLIRANRAADAVPILEAITLNRIQENAEVWAMLGRAHLSTESPTLALSALNESLRIEPDQVEIRALRGSALRNIGDFEGALVDYEAARELAPDSAALAYACGLIHLQTGQIEQAETALRFAAQKLEDNAGVQLIHALLAYSIEQNAAAKASMKAYNRLVPQGANPTAVYLSYVLSLQSNEALPELNGDTISSYFEKTLDRKQAIDAAGLAESAEQARKQICAATFWMAQYHSAIGERENAIKLLEIATEMGNPDLTEYQLAKWQLEHSD